MLVTFRYGPVRSWLTKTSINISQHTVLQRFRRGLYLHACFAGGAWAAPTNDSDLLSRHVGIAWAAARTDRFTLRGQLPVCAFAFTSISLSRRKSCKDPQTPLISHEATTKCSFAHQAAMQYVAHPVWRSWSVSSGQHAPNPRTTAKHSRRSCTLFNPYFTP